MRPNRDNGDAYLIKTDPAGNRLWQKTYGGSAFDWGHSVDQTSDGGYLIAGCTTSHGAGRGDVYLVKTDSTGRKVWRKTFGGNDADWGRSVRQSSDGGYIIVGYTKSNDSGTEDVYLIKTCSPSVASYR